MKATQLFCILSLARTSQGHAGTCEASDTSMAEVDVASVLQLRKEEGHSKTDFVEKFLSMQYSWKQSEEAIIPLSLGHRGCQVFDPYKLKAYLSDSLTVMGQAYVTQRTLILEGMESVSDNMNIGAKVDGHYGVPFGASMKASIAMEFSTTSSSISTHKFVQERIDILVADVKLPVPDKFNLKKLRSLMSEEMKQRLHVSTPADAEAAVALCGPFWLNSAALGASAKMTIEDESSSQTSTQAMEADVSASFSTVTGGVDASTNLAFGHNEKLSGRKYSFDLRANGGNVSKLLSGGLQDWKNTAADGPQIVKYNLAPLHLLVDEKTPAYELMKNAVVSKAQECGDACSAARESVQIKYAEHPSYCLSVKKPRSKGIFNPILLWSCTSVTTDETQRWLLPEVGQPGVIRWAAEPSLCLNVIGNMFDAVHTGLQLYPCEAEAHKFTLNRFGQIEFPHGKMCIEVRLGKVSNGGTVSSWHCTRSWPAYGHQRWYWA